MRPEQAVIVVTGGNDGIGHHLVTALLEAGHRVAVMDLSDERLPMLASRFPDSLLSYRCDVADRAAVGNAFKFTATGGGLFVRVQHPFAQPVSAHGILKSEERG